MRAMRTSSWSRGLTALYRDDPDKADRLLFGRVNHPDRRGFLKNAGLATMAALVGGAIPFHRNMPAHFIPVALADAPAIQGKDGLVVLNDRPLSAETPAHLLDDAITPTERHFVRNNGILPARADASAWTLTVDGLVDSPMTLRIDDLKRRFDVVTAALTLECAGNGRAFFDPPADGAQWTYGAVACSEWTGIRLADVLKAAGVNSGAVYTAHEGADTHPAGAASGHPLSRGVPLAKAMDPHTLIAFAQNGRPIHPMNGAPLRLIVPGWPGSCSQKWLTRVWLRDRVHDGAKMTGTSYRVPGRPVAPGEQFGRGGVRHRRGHAGQVADHEPGHGSQERRQGGRNARLARAMVRWPARGEARMSAGCSAATNRPQPAPSPLLVSRYPTYPTYPTYPAYPAYPT